MAGANVIRLPPVFVLRPFSFIHDPPQPKMWVSTGSQFPLLHLVVARVQGRYRCIAAFHAAAKSLYGADVITVVARVLRADPAILCPYLTGVVFSAFRVDFSPGSYDCKTLYVLPHKTMPSSRKFSEAYAVFDISAPGDVRYCFLDEVPKGLPLDATQYMEEYLRDPHDRRTYSEDMEYLRKLSLLSLDILSATWPEDFAADASTPTLDMALAPRPDAVLSLSELSLQAALRELLHSEGTVTDDVLAPILARAAKNAEIITREMLRVSEPLNENGLRLLIPFVAPAGETRVDLSLWLRSGVLVADQLESRADGLQDATVLNVSSCATLTSDVLASLVARMPHLQHVIALDCPMLDKPTVPLALLESKDLKDALRFRNMQENGEGFKDCVHYVDPSDPPPGLTVLFYTRRIVIGGVRPREVRRYGVELSTFGVTGVAHGFTTLLRMLSHHDLIYFLGFTGLNFVMRAAFQGLDARGSLGLLPPLVPVGTPSDNEGPPFSFLSHTPGQKCDALPPRSERVFLQESMYPDDSVPPPAPRHPGWVLMLDSQAGIPDLPYWQIGQQPLLDTIRANKKDDTLYRVFRRSFPLGMPATLDAPCQSGLCARQTIVAKRVARHPRWQLPAKRWRTRMERSAPKVQA
ncbi:hypothetical protein EXIGLDRAFT_781091 [Exidia glandulosa HHB12029]|uniref:Uncharacterized protein n=1 Tax=Exidia glandulosa HHB12029 TaxID=1314781 RepID=A0A165BD01_EXIGL|nr:hypothetical protein EXIGLDRAFT_781091 [Exidia glandulosa HHB12029]